MKPIIFSVEDDINIQNVIKIALKNSNFDIRAFDDGDSLFDALETEVPDLVLLDIMLPKYNGLEILKKLKENPRYHEVPVMIISAKVSEVDKVVGLDAGADDYLIKPFGVLELVSRVKAILRRYKTDEETSTMQVNGIFIDEKQYLCAYNDQTITLTRKEFELLSLLMKNRDRIVTRDEILNIVWGYQYIGESRTVDVHIKEIRKKLKNSGLEEKAIETIRGIGYRFIL